MEPPAQSPSFASAESSLSGLRETITSSAAESKGIQSKLRQALSANAVRIMDLFVEWDTNGDQKVSKNEFRKAMTELGFTESRPHVDAVFDSFDVQGTGTLTYKELLKGLRRTEEPTERKGINFREDQHEIVQDRRKSRFKRFSVPPLQEEDTDQSPEAVLQRGLREALQVNAVRVLDLFKEWDEDQNGVVSKDEFMRALPLLGLKAKNKDAEMLFRSFDPDNTGTIELRELQSALRGQKGAGGEAKDAKGKGRNGRARVKHSMQILGKPLENTDGMDDGQVVEVLREALSKEAQRVIDLFKEWDDNSDGVISRQEFHAGMVLLGLEASTKVVDRLFDLFDPNRSGEIDYKEFAIRLKKSSGAADGSEKTTMSKPLYYKTRNPVPARQVSCLAPQKAAKVDLYKVHPKPRKGIWNAAIEAGATNETIAGIRDYLRSHAARVIDLFNTWDRDGSGTIDPREFRTALTFIGIKASRAEIDQLFDTFDTDDSGTLSLREFSRVLRRADIVLSDELRQGAVPFTTRFKSSASEAGGQTKSRPNRAKGHEDSSSHEKAEANAPTDEDPQKSSSKSANQALDGSGKSTKRLLDSAKSTKRLNVETDSQPQVDKRATTPDHRILQGQANKKNMVAKEGGRYYPNAAHRSVPDWGAGQSVSTVDLFRMRPPRSHYTGGRDGMQSGEWSDVSVDHGPTLPTSLDAGFRDKDKHYEMLHAPTVPLSESPPPMKKHGGFFRERSVHESLVAEKGEGPQQQKWCWVFKNMWRRNSEWPTKLQIADTVLCTHGVMSSWFFTALDGTVKRKHSDKLLPGTVREAFERAALSVGNRGGLSAVRRNDAGAQILSHDAVRDLLRDSADLNGIEALQLFVQGKGGNATRYVCEYKFDRASYKATHRVLKLVYIGVDGLTGNKWGGSNEKPEAHTFLSQDRNLNNHLMASTEGLVKRLENNSGLTLLYMQAEFVISETDVPWFIGATDVVTQRFKPRAIKTSPTPHARVSPTLQTAQCMGDYCDVAGDSDIKMTADGHLHKVTDAVDNKTGDGESADESQNSRGPRTKPSGPTNAKGMPTYWIPYRSILLDRTLVQSGVAAGGDAPAHILLKFQAKARRRLELHYRTAHVCPSCYLYYTKLIKELERKHQELIPPISESKTIPIYASQDFRSGVSGMQSWSTSAVSASSATPASGYAPAHGQSKSMTRAIGKLPTSWSLPALGSGGSRHVEPTPGGRLTKLKLPRVKGHKDVLGSGNPNAAGSDQCHPPIETIEMERHGDLESAPFARDEAEPGGARAEADIGEAEPRLAKADIEAAEPDIGEAELRPSAADIVETKPRPSEDISKAEPRPSTALLAEGAAEEKADIAVEEQLPLESAQAENRVDASTCEMGHGTSIEEEAHTADSASHGLLRDETAVLATADAAPSLDTQAFIYIDEKGAT
ncbi:hypothetical protein AB1Y20_013183 [Prymnesium parvum]|uniref:EF-hand domain-containing protein n=1 Tax=Prymnesium parvum TaxID=97485 RepID=A0AB34ILG2_PRYPA